MKRLGWFVVLLLAGILIVAVFYRESLVLRVTGIRPFVEDRVYGWVQMGADEKELDAALRRIYDPKGTGPGSWVYELSKQATGHEKAAVQAESAGDKATAAREYKTASWFYYFSRFPFVGSPAKAEAYRRHMECYLKAARYFEPPLEVVRIPFEGKEMIAYLRVPKAEKPAVIILTGGVDTWKSDMDLHVEPMLEQGMAVLAMDMPGTGESQWPLGPDGEKIYTAAIEYLKARPDLDGERVGVYMISFGGYFAVKLALTDPKVKAAVNVGGPVEICFTAEHVKKVPEVMVATIAHAMRTKIKGSAEEMAETVKPMRLSVQGLLKKPERQAALLSINGAKDELVTIEDLYILSKNGIQQEECVYPDDGHCAPKHAKEYTRKAAAWLKEKLTR